MQTTVTTAMRGRFTGMRTIIMTLGIVALGLSLLPAAAQANQRGGSVNDNATFQILLCEAGGGEVIYDSYITPRDGYVFISVECDGGTFDGMNCLNTKIAVNCTGMHPHSAPAPNGGASWAPIDAVAVLEHGSLAQITQMVTEVQIANGVAPTTSVDLTRFDSEPTTRSSSLDPIQQHKHGKKGGKSRRH